MWPGQGSPKQNGISWQRWNAWIPASSAQRKPFFTWRRGSDSGGGCGFHYWTTFPGNLHNKPGLVGTLLGPVRGREKKKKKKKWGKAMVIDVPEGGWTELGTADAAPGPAQFAEVQSTLAGKAAVKGTRGYRAGWSRRVGEAAGRGLSGEGAPAPIMQKASILTFPQW